MILELDKTYKTRCGIATKLLHPGPIDGQFISDFRWVYISEEGTNYVYGPNRPSPHDIVGIL